MEELWDIARVAEYLGVSERTVYNRVRSGELPASKVGRLWRVRPSDLERWLAGVTTTGLAVPDADLPGPYPCAVVDESLLVVAETSPMPTRQMLERLLEPLTDQLERRLAFVGLLSTAIETLGWPPPVIVGGHAVEYYTAGDYPTVDIDLAGASEPISEVLDAWGFLRSGRHWYDDQLRILVEAPGSRPDSEALAHVIGVDLVGVTAYILGVEDVVIDRLCAAKFWKDEDSTLWSEVMLEVTQELDLGYIRRRAEAEDVVEELERLLRKRPID